MSTIIYDNTNHRFVRLSRLERTLISRHENKLVLAGYAFHVVDGDHSDHSFTSISSCSKVDQLRGCGK